MRTFVFLPPLPRMSGGLAVLIRMGEILACHGFDVCFVARERTPWLAPYEEGGAGRPELFLWRGGDAPLVPAHSGGSGDSRASSAAPGSGDIWLIPEGWPHALLPGLRAGARVVVYVQNWAYLLSDWPAGLDPTSLPAHYLAVSRPVAWHVTEVTGRPAPVLRPGIDLSLFSPASSPSAASPVTIGWMPRKNRALARQIREIVAARRSRYGRPQPQWLEIANMSQAEVAAALRRCEVFLATGFPEGCPLPPLEAMACGCLCAGFSGFGGWDYMRVPADSGISEQPDRQTLAGNAAEDELPPGRVPLWVPEPVRRQAEERPANGFWTADGEVMSAALALERAVDAAANPERRARMARAARFTAERYGTDAQERRLLELWTLARENRFFVHARGDEEPQV